MLDCSKCERFLGRRCIDEDKRDKEAEIAALYPHGLFSTDAHYNFHFGPHAKCIYWYMNSKMRERAPLYRMIHNTVCCKKNKRPLIVGENYLVSILDKIISKLEVDPDILEMYDVASKSTSVKGECGMKVVTEVLRRRGWDVEIVTDEEMQLRGIDLIARKDGYEVYIDVKFDEPAGPKSHPCCTGNLAVQTKEINQMGAI